MLVVDLLGRSLLGEVHVSSQGWQNAHNYLIFLLAEQLVFVGRSKMDMNKQSCERAAQEYEQEARDEVHDTAAQATEMSGGGKAG